jgi:hypothetical protein
VDFGSKNCVQGDIRPRVKSYGERDMPLDGYLSPIPKTEEVVILKVHGIVDAGTIELSIMNILPIVNYLFYFQDHR